MRGSILVLAALLAAGSLAAQETRKAGDIVIEQQTLVGRNGETIPYELGTIYVPENRANPKSRLIGVGFARFRAKDSTASAGTPPIFLLPGGPGSSYLDALPNISGEVGLYQKVGDVVIVDQRGFSPRGDKLQASGMRPAEPFDHPASPKDAAEADKAVARAIVANAPANGWDLAGYTVLECVEDVNDIRKALSYNKISLSGTSFGSQWSFALMRKRPEIIARALLSGVEPLDHGFDSPTGVMAAVRRIAAVVEQDSRFAPYLPPGGVFGAAREVIAKLEREPIKVAMDGDTVVVGAEDFRRSTPKSAQFIGRVLGFYHGQINLQEWAGQMAQQRRAQNDGVRLIQPLIDGSLGITPERLKQLESDTATYYTGHWNWASYVASADIWPSPDIGDSIRRPVKTDIPVVFAQGDWDTSTPIENTFEVAPYFPKSHVIVAKNGGHGVIRPIAQQHPAVMEQLLEFLRTGNIAGLPKEVVLKQPEFSPPSYQPSMPAQTAAPTKAAAAQ